MRTIVLVACAGFLVVTWTIGCPASGDCTTSSCPSGTACVQGLCTAGEGEGEGAAEGEGEGGEGEGEGGAGEGEGEGEVGPLVAFAENEDDHVVAQGQVLLFDISLGQHGRLPCDLNGAPVAAGADGILHATLTVDRTEDDFGVLLTCASDVAGQPATFSDDYRVLIDGVTVTGLAARGDPVDVVVNTVGVIVCTIDGFSFLSSAHYTEPATETGTFDVTCQDDAGAAATTRFVIPVQITVDAPVATLAGIRFRVGGDASAACTATQDGVDSPVSVVAGDPGARAFAKPAGASAAAAVTASIACVGTASGALANRASRTAQVLYGDVDAVLYASLVKTGTERLIAGDLVLDGVSAAPDAGVVAIGGNLALSDAPIAAVALASLTSVGGTLRIERDASLTAISFPALVSAGSVSIATNAVLTGLSAPELARVDGDFGLSDNGAASSSAMVVDLHELVAVGGSLVVTHNPRLRSLDAQRLFSQLSDAFGVGGTVTLTANGP